MRPEFGRAENTSMIGSTLTMPEGFHAVPQVPLGKAICIGSDAHDRRLGIYDKCLLRPLTVPKLVRFARQFMRAPRRSAAD